VHDPHVLPFLPERVGCIEDARALCEAFVVYDDHEHRHSGIGEHTPACVHDGTAEDPFAAGCHAH